MGNLLNKIINNNALFISVILCLFVILVVLVILIFKSNKNNKKINIYEEDLEDEDIKKVKNVKKEDIIESPDIFEEEKKEIVKEEKKEVVKKEITDREIEERYDKEKEKEIEEIKEENSNSHIAQLISKMEEDSKLKPEDVVAKFEKEQEEQSIISYKELVNAVKNRQEDNYEDELEFKPLSTVSNIMEEMSNQKEEEIEEEPIIADEKVTFDDEEFDGYEEKKFKKTDVISPVYGIVEKAEDEGYYVNLNQQDEEVLESTTALDEVYKQMADDLVKSNEKLGETTSIDELTRNEEFLQSLKDFRNKL